MADMDATRLLEQLGLGQKEIRIYLTLLTGGPSSVRKLAKDTGLNRGSAYDALKSLQQHGLAGMYQKHKKQFFMAEEPEKLQDLVEHQERSISSLKRNVAEALPELRSLYVHGGSKPVVKYYEGPKGVNIILHDILRTMSESPDKTYRVYSSMTLREYIYKEFPHFTKERIARGLHVRVIAVGAGGSEQPMSERRWLPAREGSPTYNIVYGGKVAFLSQDARGALIGVLVEDERVAESERLIFDHVWATLAPVKTAATVCAQ